MKLEEYKQFFTNRSYDTCYGWGFRKGYDFGNTDKPMPVLRPDNSLRNKAWNEGVLDGYQAGKDDTKAQTGEITLLAIALVSAGCVVLGVALQHVFPPKAEVEIVVKQQPPVNYSVEIK